MIDPNTGWTGIEGPTVRTDPCTGHRVACAGMLHRIPLMEALWVEVTGLQGIHADTGHASAASASIGSGLFTCSSSYSLVGMIVSAFLRNAGRISPGRVASRSCTTL